jgi:hypothetical protein
MGHDVRWHAKSRHEFSIDAIAARNLPRLHDFLLCVGGFAPQVADVFADTQGTRKCQL